MEHSEVTVGLSFSGGHCFKADMGVFSHFGRRSDHLPMPYRNNSNIRWSLSVLCLPNMWRATRRSWWSRCCTWKSMSLRKGFRCIAIAHWWSSPALDSLFLNRFWSLSRFIVKIHYVRMSLAEHSRRQALWLTILRGWTASGCVVFLSISLAPRMYP